jgi:hypothetical protein
MKLFPGTTKNVFLIGDQLVDPYMFPARLTNHGYGNFLQINLSTGRSLLDKTSDPYTMGIQRTLLILHAAISTKCFLDAG